MRLIIAAASALAVIALAAFDAPRANGAYSNTHVANADACARLCAGDTLCMAWVYTEGYCALRATVPASLPASVATGLSPRAPSALRPEPQALTPASIAAPPPARTHAPEPMPRRPVEPVETAALLGGPEEDSASLRPAFGGAR